MKYAEFYINNSKLAFFNSNFGVESVFLNEKRLSKKFSFSGAKHNIKTGNRDLVLESKYEQFGNKEIQLTLKENGKTIEKRVCPVNKKQRTYWMIIGIISGILLYEFLIYIL